jgi:hypothetical protein
VGKKPGGNGGQSDADEEVSDKSATEVKVAFIGLLPQLFWAVVATIALLLLWKPVVKLLDEGRISKVDVGIIQIEIAQAAIAAIKDSDRKGIPDTPATFKPIADRAKMIQNKLIGSFILWVDDENPSQNVQERRALESFGIHFDLASSTDEAIRWLDRARYDAVISDVSRPPESTNNVPCFSSPLPAGAGCVMAAKMHQRYGDKMPPTIFYSANFPESAGTPPYGFGVTNRVDRLFQLVFDALERRTTIDGNP